MSRRRGQGGGRGWVNPLDELAAEAAGRLMDLGEDLLRERLGTPGALGGVGVQGRPDPRADAVERLNEGVRRQNEAFRPTPGPSNPNKRPERAKPMRLKRPRTLRELCAWLASCGIGNKFDGRRGGDVVDGVYGVTVHADVGGQLRAYYVEFDEKWEHPADPADDSEPEPGAQEQD